MSMDRKNKKDAQRGIRDRGDGRSRLDPFLDDYPGAAPVPIRSALTSSIQSPSLHRQSSSPMREPYGPPSGGLAGSPSPGFGYPKSAVNYASSPSRPSPLSAGIRPSVPGQLSLKSAQSPLRPPPTTAFSSSFSHSTLSIDRSGPPLSASYADSTLRKSIWAPSDTPEEQLSPARRPAQPRMLHSSEDVFRDDDPYDHGEDLVPSFLLTPTELARRTSRRDSGDSFSASPSRSNIHNPLWNGERLAQSAGATMGPPGFLQGLWSAEGADARKSQQDEEDFTFGPATAQPPPRQSLLTQQRSPESPKRTMREPAVAVEGPFLIRPVADPHSPSARALREHAPGQSLPGGLANALSRLHLHGPRPSSGLAHEAQGGVGDSSGNVTPPSTKAIRVPGVQRDEHEDEALFTMDG